MPLERDPKPGSRVVRRSLEWSLVLGGAALLSHSFLDWHKYASFQHIPLATALTIREPKRNSTNRTAGNDLRVIGRLKIERLGLSAVIVEGDDDKSLAVGVGHMPGTVNVGSLGNAVLAGHRDTAFWPLRNARVGDTIAVTADKAYRYRIVSIRVVDAEDVSALENSDTAKLTLVSCYPFRHVGPAPRRIVLTAELLNS